MKTGLTIYTFQFKNQINYTYIPYTFQNQPGLTPMPFYYTIWTNLYNQVNHENVAYRRLMKYDYEDYDI